MTLPDWNDDDALADWVGPLMPEPPRDYLFRPWPVLRDAPMQGKSREEMEREAIAAAQQGNFKLLGWLMDPPNQDLLSHRPPRLSQEAEALIAARLQGTFKARRGKPKQTVARRRVDNPIHAAADEVPVIQNILRQHYPRQRGVRDRAIGIAALRAGIEHERLAHHLRSPHQLRDGRT